MTGSWTSRNSDAMEVRLILSCDYDDDYDDDDGDDHDGDDGDYYGYEMIIIINDYEQVII